LSTTAKLSTKPGLIREHERTGFVKREKLLSLKQFLTTLPNHADAQHAGIEKCKWLRAGTPALIPLFEGFLSEISITKEQHFPSLRDGQ